jgi:amino acid permease
VSDDRSPTDEFFDNVNKSMRKTVSEQKERERKEGQALLVAIGLFVLGVIAGLAGGEGLAIVLIAISLLIFATISGRHKRYQ